MIDRAAQIRERVSTLDFAESVGLQVDRNGFCKCPFHAGDHTASLRIYKDRARGWTCFGCHKGGDVISFAMEWYQVKFPEALKRIDADFNLGLYQSLNAFQIMALNRKAAEQKVKREAELAEEKAMEEDFWKAYDWWFTLDSIAQDEAPTDPEASISDLYVEAMNMIDQAIYEL